jgi:hypothetical protein
MLGSLRRASLCQAEAVTQELPDFHLPHAEKIEWMIETHGFALEAVAARPDTDPPVPGYTYTVGFPAAVDFPEVALFGLTPSAARGLLDLVADLRRAGTDVPVGVPLVGLLDGEQRCMFLPVDLAVWGEWFSTAIAWHRSASFEVVQMLWPDRNGFLPYEAGFDQRLRFAQPVLGLVGEPSVDDHEGA